MFPFDVLHLVANDILARFFDNSEEFIAANGGNPHDFWGVYKERERPFVDGADRNGGLYVFKLQGTGSGS